MRFIIVIAIAVLILGGCTNNNPVSPQSLLQLGNVGWIYTNNAADIDSGRFEINLNLQYGGASLTPGDIAFYKITAAGTTWTIPVTDTNLFDA